VTDLPVGVGFGVQSPEQAAWVAAIADAVIVGTALARVIERWIAHFFGVAVKVAPLRQIEDPRWAWHIGLDAQSTAVLNDLWRGEAVETGRLRRLLALFRLDFAERAAMRSDLAGRPVYLALGMDEANVVRMKPQNLLVNLPLAARS